MVDVSFSLYDLEILLMIIVRIAGMISVAPIFGMKGVPAKVKAGLAIFVSYIVYLSGDFGNLEYNSIIEFAIVIAKEAVVGLSVGLVSNLCMQIISFAGNIIDIDIGFSMATLFDQTSQTQTTISGTFYNYMLLLIMLVTNTHFFLIRVICDSFSVIPLGGAIFKADYLYETILKFIADYFIIGFRIVLPVFASIMILNAILGILAKASPQMSMFVIGMQLKVFFGFAILIITTQFLPVIADYIFDEMEKMVNLLLKGMY